MVTTEDSPAATELVTEGRSTSVAVVEAKTSV